MIGLNPNTLFKTIAIVLAMSLAACGDSVTTAAKGDNFVEVWKTPTCGCCSEWVEHLKDNGFTVKVNDVDNTDSFRAALGMPQQYGSCHSAKVGGYAIEGHVPAADIQKLLSQKPADVAGLSVPAMPMGSPGMEHPDFPQKRAEYDVLLISKRGDSSTFTHYDPIP